MNLGLIARADDGGLGQMTREFYAHLDPAATLVVDLKDAGRSPARCERYATGPGEARLCGYPLDDRDVDWLCERTDVVYSAEVLYHDTFTLLANTHQTDVVVHAMPELYDTYDNPGARVWLPTPWERRRFPTTVPIVPVPVATERFTPRCVTSIETALHISSPAMRDRNGTDLVKEACEHARRRFTLLVSGPSKPPERTKIGVVDVVPVDDTTDYWERYDDVDLLVLPRRYGGLSLPMQEAAAAGVPTLTLNSEPQSSWLPPSCLVPTTGSAGVRMKGGQFPVYRAAPESIAAALDGLGARPDLVHGASSTVRAHADALSWASWTEEYRRILAGPNREEP